MKPQDFKELLDRYAKGDCTPAEEKLVNQWYENIGNNDEYTEGFTEEELERRRSLESVLWAKVNPRPESMAEKPSYFVRAAAVVAALALAGVGAYAFMSDASMAEQAGAWLNSITSRSSHTEISTGSNETREISLSDGSQLVLHENSEVKYPDRFKTGEREIYMAGEALFTVRKDDRRPFVVHAGELVTKAIGTTFEIRAYEHEKDITVLVREGTASVFIPANAAGNVDTPVMLTANQQMVYNRDSREVHREYGDARK